MVNSSAQPVVVCQRLTKVFKDFWMRDRARAVDNLTFEIQPHEVFGILGPNGSGKSTTIKLLLGLIFATRGKASILGHAAGSTAINERIGFLPEESYLYKFLTGEETLRFTPSISRRSTKTSGDATRFAPWMT